jgi:hypothetical protein
MKPGEVGKAWGETLEMNRTLIHLDISFNKIDSEESKYISESLLMNQTLIGFHF